MAGTFTTWSSAQMVADVQGWVDHPSSNFGWLIRGNEVNTLTARKLASREHLTESIRPRLTIEYTPPSTSCPADIVPPPNGDGVVNVSDLLAVINAWGPCPAPCPPHCTADITQDCAVNVSDLLAVINSWGPCP